MLNLLRKIFQPSFPTCSFRARTRYLIKWFSTHRRNVTEVGCIQSSSLMHSLTTFSHSSHDLSFNVSPLLPLCELSTINRLVSFPKKSYVWLPPFLFSDGSVFDSVQILLFSGFLLFDFALRVYVVRFCSYGLYSILFLVFVSGSFHLDP